MKSEGVKKMSDLLIKSAKLPEGIDLQQLTESATIKQANKEPLTPNEELIVKTFKESIDKFKDYVDKVKKSGQDPESFFSKHFPSLIKLLGWALIGGLAIYEIKSFIDANTGCYQFSTKETSKKVRVGCSEDQCSCKNICDASGKSCCATPSCTNANGYNYLWMKPSPLDAIFSAFEGACTALGSGAGDLLSPLKPLLLYIGLGALGIIVIWIIFKVIEAYLESKKESAEER